MKVFLVKPEIVDLIGKEHTLCVLFALRARGPQRFGDMERQLGANPAQVDRALKWLQERVYVLASTIPGERGPVRVQYALSKRGRAFLDAFDRFMEGADARRGVLGEKQIRDLESLAG